MSIDSINFQRVIKLEPTKLNHKLWVAEIVFNTILFFFLHVCFSWKHQYKIPTRIELI